MNHLNISSVHKYIALICFHNNIEILGTGFPSPSTLTEKNLPNQIEKVFIATGGNSGLGFELV